jgi:hypothetical protein
MAKFLFQPDPIDGVEFKPVAIDIHVPILYDDIHIMMIHNH